MTLPYWPRGLKRETAAEYVGVPLEVWDRLVSVGDMPTPRRIGGELLWDRFAIDEAFDLLRNKDH
jgi:predicted DNA-binding transcriptional regulator AlpA